MADTQKRRLALVLSYTKMTDIAFSNIENARELKKIKARRVTPPNNSG